MAEWTCPRCGQRFLRRNQGHSCLTQTLEDLFAGRPAALRLARRVHQAVASMGPMETAVTKSQASFRVPAGTRFCWVWRPPKGVKGIPDDAIVLTFDLAHRLASPRLREVVEPHPGRFTHHLVIEDESQLDDEVLGWLREARATASRTNAGR